MDIFERIIPFPERMRWSMLSAALHAGASASSIATRLGWPLYRVQKTVMAPKARVRISDVAEWFYAVDENLEVKINIVPREAA